MKKDVTYYLEDVSRLKEISKSELDEWIAEMPYHQPLQMLAGIKSEMEGHTTDDDPKVYAAYFAEDYEAYSSGKSKKKKKKSAENTKVEIDKISEEKISLETSGIGVISSDLADDVLEEGVIQEVLEEQTPADSEELKLVSSQLADDTLEDEVVQEVMEEKTEMEVPSEALSPIETPEVNTEEMISDSEVKEEKVVLPEEETDKDNKKVSYSEYTNITPKKKKKKKKKVEFTTESTSIALDEGKTNIEPVEEIEAEQKKKKKKKKVKNKLSKKKKKSASSEKKLKVIQEAEVKPKKKKKKKPTKAKSESKASETSKIKQKTKKQRSKKKEASDNIRYVIVDSASERNFKLKDYEGVSSYTSWLLEQKSINDAESSKGMNAAEMKKSKKKKKKNKKLKIAQDSVKKQDYIISEPLANILAMQGHTKKAKKMYQKLAKVFPEKAAFYYEKIEALSKKEN